MIEREEKRFTQALFSCVVMGLYDEVEIEDMTWDAKERCFTYACPCGDLFSITLDELRQGEEIARCPSCTLYVTVIYNEVRVAMLGWVPHVCVFM